MQNRPPTSKQEFTSEERENIGNPVVLAVSWLILQSLGNLPCHPSPEFGEYPRVPLLA